MARIVLACVFIFLIHSTLKAQVTSDDLYWSYRLLRKPDLYAGFDKSEVLIKGSYLYNSTAVTNSFLNKQLYQQETPSINESEPSAERLKEHNLLGLDANASITGTARLADTTLLVEAGIGYRDFSYLYFTRDLFRLAFLDYSEYVEKYAQIGESNMREYNYSSVFLGLHKVLSKNFQLGGRISLIKGGFYQEVNIEKGTVYLSDGGLLQNPSGELNARFQYYSQERQTSPFSADNGWGGAADLYAQICLKSSVIALEVKDLGFIRWKNMDTYIGDRDYTYSGYDIVDLLRPNNTGGDPTPDEVAAELGIPKQRVNRTVMLPTKVQLSYLQKFSDDLSLKADVGYLFLPGSKPSARLTALIATSKALFVAPSVVIGGFGKVNTQLGVGLTVDQTWTLQLHVMALEYVLAPDRYSGHGLDVFIAKRF